MNLQKTGVQCIKALLTAIDKDYSLLISGNGDIVGPDDGIIGIGPGGRSMS